MTLEERFWLKVDKQAGDDACWLWIAAKQKRYGVINIDRELVRSHRVAWFLATGEWPQKQVLHTCDNPPCVRFRHLFEGTQKENMEDMSRKGRATTAKGEHHSKALLTAEQVVVIREKYRAGIKIAKIARELNIPWLCAAGVAYGRTYTSVPELYGI